MRATYCKKKNTYTTEVCKPCTCSEHSKQGVGSLVNQSISNITKIDTKRTISS
jgi:hypothetical protein